MRKQKEHLGAFTLLEMLVAMAVIGLLVAISVPVQSAVRVAANRSVCSSNLRQIGVGLKLYANEHNGAFPPSTHSTGTLGKQRSWIYQLEAYIGDVDAIRICPAEPESRQQYIRQVGGSSYAMNDLVVDDVRYHNQFWIPEPSRTMLLCVLSEDRAPSGTRDHIHGAEWGSWAAILGDLEPDRHRSGARSATRTSGSSNYLYVDGHVETIEASALKRKVDAGLNPAMPPDARYQ